MEFIDTHLHLDHERFADDRAAVIARAEEAGVVQLVTIGTDVESSRRAIELAEQFPQVYAAVGIHPHDASKASEAAYDALRDLAAHPRVVAIGEIGLDFYYDFSPREVQVEVFARQLALAHELGLPAVVHDRDAHEQVEAILAGVRAEGGQGGRAGSEGSDLQVVLHSFTGSWEMAERCLAWGCYVSTGGMLTFKNAQPIRDVMRRVPWDRLMLETDAPYLSPEPHRGKRNEPSRVPLVAEALAALWGTSPAEVAHQTTANARRFFRLPEV